MSARQGSNLEPAASKADALPIELRADTISELYPLSSDVSIGIPHIRQSADRRDYRDKQKLKYHEFSQKSKMRLDFLCNGSYYP